MREILNSLQSHDTYLIEFCPLLFWELNFSIVQNGCPGNAEVSGFQILPRYSFKSLCENWGLSSHVISPQTWFIQSQIIVHHPIFGCHIILFSFFQTISFYFSFLAKKKCAKHCMCYSQVKNNYLMTGFFIWLDLQWEGVFTCRLYTGMCIYLNTNIFCLIPNKIHK